MKAIRYLIFVLLLGCAIFMTGCGLANSYYLTYNFTKGEVQTATVGSEMLNWTLTYKNDVYGTILGTATQSLTYSGKQGMVIKIFYRETSNDIARPAFTQELTYDITDDRVITFRNTKIQIIEATNSTITFIVLECPAFEQPSGAKMDPRLMKRR